MHVIQPSARHLKKLLLLHREVGVSRRSTAGRRKRTSDLPVGYVALVVRYLQEEQSEARTRWEWEEERDIWIRGPTRRVTLEISKFQFLRRIQKIHPEMKI